MADIDLHFNIAEQIMNSSKRSNCAVSNRNAYGKQGRYQTTYYDSL